MNSIEKTVEYTAQNTYSTLNELTNETTTIWLVFHGLGYLSRYFIREFEFLNKKENYVIAPQAPSKYYQGSNFKRVGACWLTKENTVFETLNVLNYTKKIYDYEISPKLLERPDLRFNILGFSQGVSIAMRFLAHKKIDCNKLIAHSGGIPNELESNQFEHFTGKFHFIYGVEDEYIDDARIEFELKKCVSLLYHNFGVHRFDGGHKIDAHSITKL